MTPTATALSPSEQILTWVATTSPGHDFTDTALAERLNIPAATVARICATMAENGELWGRRPYNAATAYVVPCPTVCRRCSTCESYGPAEPAPRRPEPVAPPSEHGPVLPNLLRWIDRQERPWSRRQAWKGCAQLRLPQGAAALQPYLDKLVAVGVIAPAGYQPSGYQLPGSSPRTGPKYRLYQVAQQ